MTPPLRLAFMGTPAFAVPALEALAQSGHTIAAVYTQPPRPETGLSRMTLLKVGIAALWADR